MVPVKKKVLPVAPQNAPLLKTKIATLKEPLLPSKNNLSQRNVEAHELLSALNPKVNTMGQHHAFDHPIVNHSSEGCFSGKIDVYKNYIESTLQTLKAPSLKSAVPQVALDNQMYVQANAKSSKTKPLDMHADNINKLHQIWIKPTSRVDEKRKISSKVKDFKGSHPK